MAYDDPERLKALKYEHVVRVKLKDEFGIPPDVAGKVFPYQRMVDVWKAPDGQFRYHAFDLWPNKRKTPAFVAGHEFVKVEAIAAKKLGYVLTTDRKWVKKEEAEARNLELLPSEEYTPL